MKRRFVKGWVEGQRYVQGVRAQLFNSFQGFQLPRAGHNCYPGAQPQLPCFVISNVIQYDVIGWDRMYIIRCAMMR